MPTRFPAGAPPVVEFDPRVEISPFVLFRRLREGRPPLIVDVRVAPAGDTLEGALPHPGEGWQPPDPEAMVVLIDEDGTEAVPLARHLQASGHPQVRALFGGLELYRFALDPQVVGAETYLRPLPPPGP